MERSIAAEIGSIPFVFGVDDGEGEDETDCVGVSDGWYCGRVFGEMFWYWG